MIVDYHGPLTLKMMAFYRLYFASLSHKKIHLFRTRTFNKRGIAKSPNCKNPFWGWVKLRSWYLQSPTLQKSIAFARLPSEINPSMEVQVVIRDQIFPAKVVKPAFVRRGQILN
jgi:hypothetical protein